MACFLAPAAEAVVVTVVKKAVQRTEQKHPEQAENGSVKASEKIGWLSGLLWGGSGLLAFEHLWHGEITPFFPFLTAASNPADTAEMLHEIAVSGTAMSVLVTAVWAGLVFVTNRLTHREAQIQQKAGAEL